MNRLAFFLAILLMGCAEAESVDYFTVGHVDNVEAVEVVEGEGTWLVLSHPEIDGAPGIYLEEPLYVAEVGPGVQEIRSPVGGQVAGVPPRCGW